MENENSEIDELKQKKISKKNKPKEKERNFIDVLKMLAPGTAIRTGLNDLLRARMGALIVVDSERLTNIIKTGFRINSKFSSQRMVELAKMDGAIIISKDLKKILYANTLLSPSNNIPTNETGIRHKAAERTARQAETIVIAVSERRNKISLYVKDTHHEIERSSEILRRTAETLQILEKQREIFNDFLDNLNLLELKRLVTINDVSSVLQRLEIIKRISNVVKRYLVELGKDGMIVNMRLKELIKGVDKEEKMILEDYFGQNYSFAVRILEKMDFDFLLEPLNISRMLFEELHDKPISPKGLRILSKTNLLEKNVNSLIARFGKLDKLLIASDEEILEVLENEGLVSFFKEEIYNLKEKISVGKRI